MTGALNHSPRLVRLSPLTELSSEQRMLALALCRAAMRSPVRTFYFGMCAGASLTALLFLCVLWS